MRPSYIQPSSTLFYESDRSTDSVIAVLDDTQALIVCQLTGWA